MLIPHIVSTEADKVFVNILNNQTLALSDGDFVVWNTTTPDGVRTTQAASTTLSLVVGPADGAVASGAYGLAQSYGYKSAALVSNDTSDTIAAGCILIPVAAADHVKWSSAGDGLTGLVYAAESYDSDTQTPVAATKGVFLRCM